MKHLTTAALAALLLAATAARAEEPADAPVATADQVTSAPTQVPATTAPAVGARGAAAAAAAAPSVAQQIDDFIRTSPAALPDSHASGVVSSDDETGPRQPHGFVEASIGSHGYRSAYAQSDLPIGKTGTLTIGVGETRNGWAYGGGYPYGGYGGPYGGYGYGYPYRGTTQTLALGLRLGDSNTGPRDGRCRSAWADQRFAVDPMLPVSADRFSGCPYPPAGAPPTAGD